MTHQTTYIFNPALRTMLCSNFKSLAENLNRKLITALTLLIFFCSLHTANAVTLTVSNTNDVGAGSLRQTLLNASNGDTINFSVTGVITVLSELDISKNITIQGPGADLLAIDGNNSTRIFLDNNLAMNDIVISGLEIRHGNNTGAYGSAIFCKGGHLTIRYCNIHNNTIDTYGAIAVWSLNTPGASSLTIENSSIHHNTSGGYAGGIALLNATGLTISNSTLFANSGPLNGQAITAFGSNAVLRNVTIAGQSAGSSAIYITGDQLISGATIPYSISFLNCIIDNPIPNYVDDGQGTATSQGHNVSDDNSMSSFLNQTGDLNNTSSLLDPLGIQNNGGTTPTVALQCNSPAMNAGTNFFAQDQRGNARVGNADIGAFESSLVPPTPIISGSTSFCAGGFTTLNAGSYSGYNWSTGATTQTISVNTAGTFTVTVTNETGCTASASVTTLIAGTSATCSATPASCFGGNNGAASVTAGGGAPGYSYLWSTSATTSSISGLPEGTYTVTVTDPNSGCTATCSSVVTQPSQILITETHSDATCGQTSGSIDVTVSGGTPGGYYVDNFNGSNSSASLISRGYVLYRNGTFSGAPGPLWGQGNGIVFPAFNGGPDGYVGDNYNAAGNLGNIDDWMVLPAQNVTAGDIISFYSRSPLNDAWADSIRVMYNATGATLPADPNWTELGRFKVNTTGAWLQCIYNATTAGASGRFAIRYCVADGGLNGNNSDYIGVDALQLTRAGGPSYSYLWSDGNTNQDRSSLNGGTYTVTVTDGNGCTGTLSVTINFTGNPTPVISGATSFCSGGSTTLDAGGPYSLYSWSTGATTQTINVNTAGIYTVTVTNADGCTGSDSKAIGTYPAPPCSITGSNFCNGSSSQLCAAAVPGPSGGPYSYLWNTGATTQCITASSGGTYTVTVTDDINGCTSSCSKTVTEYPKPACSITGSDFCSGSGTQLCAASITGPTVNNYLWNTEATTQCITVTASGTYTITVTDANGCTNSCSKTVTEYPLPTCSITGGNFCSGSSSQLCAASITGPTVNTYLWNTGATTQCITVTASGTYTITVTDANGCTNSCSKTVTEYPLPTCSITGGNFCSGSSSQLCAASITGPTVNTYLWSTGATTQCITVTASGTYTITVTDANGCTNSCSKTVYAYQAPTCSITGNSVVCHGSTTQICGSVGTVSTYTYLWNTGATTQCITVGEGTYTVTATSTNGCTSSCSKTVTEYLKPNCSITGSDFCSGSGTQLCASTAAAPPLYTYLWSTGLTTQCIAVTTGGTYTVTVSDFNGCTSSCSKTVTAYPSPTCSITGGNFCQGSSTQLCAAANSGYLWSTGATTQCITVNTGGTYTVTVTNANGCTSSCSKTVNVKNSPGCSITGNASICPGSAAQWCAPAGLAAYLWSTGATTQCITVSIAGTYTITTTNTGGCTKSCSKTLAIKGVPNCSITGTSSICPGSSAQWCAPAGLAAYLWSNGATTQCITVNITGTYTVTTTNTGGCTRSCSKTLTIKTPPSCSISGGNFCQGSSAQLCASGGSAGYLWSTGATTKCIAVSTPGIYTVTVTNSSGCTSSCSKSVTVKPLPPCAITWNHAICPGGSAQFCAGTGLPSYLWNTGASSQCINISAAGDYTVTVTGGNGCTNSCTVKVIVQQAPVCSISGNSVVTPGQTTPVCATAGLTYLWNNGATTQCRNVAAGTYTVTVTNANGCTSSCSKTVTSAAKMAEPVVIGGDNGALEASAYPNPFNETATIEFRNTIASGHVVVELFNLTGSKMAVLFDKDVEQNVTYQTRVNSEDLAEGVYFYRIVSGDNVITGKLILLKE